jgi:beta-glucanase (GH16 family)
MFIISWFMSLFQRKATPMKKKSAPTPAPAPAPTPTPTPVPAPTPAPTPTPSFTENFANLNNWIVSNWGAPGGGQFLSGNVDLTTGMLRLKLTQDGTTPGSRGGEVQCKLLMGYGRYDLEMRAASTSPTPTDSGLPASGSITGCFNFVNNSQTEIDAPEIQGNDPDGAWFTNYAGVGNKTYSRSALPFAPERGFHKYSFIWSAQSIQFLIDDTLVATHTTNIPTAPAYMLFNLWGTNSNAWGGVATPGAVLYAYIKSFSFTPAQ